MKKIHLTAAFLLLLLVQLQAQCPVITCPTTATIGCNSPTLITATSNYSANIVSRWWGPSNVLLASSPGATASVVLNHMGTYTVQFTDILSNCTVSQTLAVSSSVNPTFSLLSQNSFTMPCTGQPSTVNIANGMTQPVPGGAVSYSMMPVGAVLQSGLLSTVNTYTSNCGDYELIMRDNATFCTSSVRVRITCAPPALSLTVSGGGSICAGSGATLSTSGANTYTWSNGSNSSSTSVSPTVTTSYTVNGNAANGCLAAGFATVTVNAGCSDVWPGDANSDGTVNSLDVFELGRFYNSTGPARSPGGNAFVGQYAGNWNGFVSSGKNRSHADCNGDGIINHNDTAAIYNNYEMTHAFKSTHNSAAGGDISIVTAPGGVAPGNWVKADIFAGTSITPLNQVYGLSFDIDYNAALFDGMYLKYTASFLNAANQNIEFRKTNLPAGILNAASVRTDQVNVNGSGQIAELWFKIKAGTAANTPVNFSVEEAFHVSANGIQQSITGGNAQTYVTEGPLGLDEAFSEANLMISPNPGSGLLKVTFTGPARASFRVNDITGRMLASGETENNDTIDLTQLENGAYFFSILSGGKQVSKKIIILH